MEEEAEIGFEDALEVAPSNRDNVGDDVRTDHPTSMLLGEEVPVPAMFSDQEVPEDETEQQPEEAPDIPSLPVTDDAAFEVEGELLYSDINKCGNLSDINNYRAIAISTSISKVFESVLLHGITSNMV